MQSCSGLARIEKQKAHGRKLAIVGGGASTFHSLDVLRAWPGDIWAINSTGSWLLDEGIKSTFLTVDAGPVSDFDTTGMEDALIASCCDPELRRRFKTVRLFDLCETSENGITGGTTTATRAPALAIRLGYCDISFFGCEGSFEMGNDHIDRNAGNPMMAIVRAGEDYLTNLGYVMQCENLIEVMELSPEVFKNRSGGLLQAMQDHPETWEVVGVSKELKEHLELINGQQGIYDGPYVPQKLAA